MSLLPLLLLLQVPQLSTSRQIDLHEPFSIMKAGSTKHKALIIGEFACELRHVSFLRAFD
jgi:hypothetical protein